MRRASVVLVVALITTGVSGALPAPAIDLVRPWPDPIGGRPLIPTGDQRTIVGTGLSKATVSLSEVLLNTFDGCVAATLAGIRGSRDAPARRHSPRVAVAV